MTSEKQKAAVRRWALAHPDKVREYQVAYRLRHPGRRAAQARVLRAANPEAARASSREWYANNKDRVRAYNRLRAYGLTQEMFDEYLDAQEGACAFCGDQLPKATNTISVDHDHETGEYRGLLHRYCNSLLGHAEKNDAFVGYIAASRIGSQISATA